MLRNGHEPTLLEDFNATTMARPAPLHLRKLVLPVRRAVALHPCLDAAPAVMRKRPARCTDSTTDTRLLVGVQTAPLNRARRDAIRSGWMQSAPEGVLVCFVVGLSGIAKSVRRTLDAEAASNSGDLMLLKGVQDGRTKAVSIAKAHAFWARAASMMPRDLVSSSAAHVAKVDDDSYVNLPALYDQLEQLRCVPRLYYGHFSYAGYRPSIFSKCGFSWRAPRPSNNDPLGCSRHGAWPAFPFALGQLEVLSADLAWHIGSSPAVAVFARAADARLAADEDPALGYWLSRLLCVADGCNVTYVHLGQSTHNLDCFRDHGLYRRPTNSSLVVHHLKDPRAMRYVSELMRRRGIVEATPCLEAWNDGRASPGNAWSRLRWCADCGEGLGSVDDAAAERMLARRVGCGRLANVRTVCNDTLGKATTRTRRIATRIALRRAIQIQTAIDS